MKSDEVTGTQKRMSKTTNLISASLWFNFFITAKEGQHAIK
jgi:hypothetical protein